MYMELPEKGNYSRACIGREKEKKAVPWVFQLGFPGRKEWAREGHKRSRQGGSQGTEAEEQPKWLGKEMSQTKEDQGSNNGQMVLLK